MALLGSKIVRAGALSILLIFFLNWRIIVLWCCVGFYCTTTWVGHNYINVCDLSLSQAQLFVTLWTVAHQATLSLGILQTRILEWVAMPSSRGSSQPRDRIQVSCITGRFFTVWATRGAQRLEWVSLSLLQGIFSIQELNWGLLHCMRILYQLRYREAQLYLSICLSAVCSTTQSCPTLCDPMGCTPLSSLYMEFFQARILEWAAISYSRGSHQPRDRTCISCIPWTGRQIPHH